MSLSVVPVIVPVAPVIVRQLGRVEYQTVFDQMRAFTAARDSATPDEIWLVEHPPVYTLGLAADRGHLLAREKMDEPQIPVIPVIQTDRGGEVTYHGPGQAVVYLMLDLRRHKPAGKFFVRTLVNRIEQAIINVLAAYGLTGERIPGAPGIYLAAEQDNLLQNQAENQQNQVGSRCCGSRCWQGAKIAALGLKVRGSGCTYHGLSLNVAMDLRPFSWINPCGYAGLATVDMQTLGVVASLHEVQQAVVRQLCALLDDAPESALQPILI